MHLALLMVAALSLAAQSVPTITTAPGTLVRWGAPGTTRCAMKGRSWAAVAGTCYYPVDLEQPAGRIAVSRSGAGHSTFARITVEPFDYGTRGDQPS